MNKTKMSVEPTMNHHQDYFCLRKYPRRDKQIVQYQLPWNTINMKKFFILMLIILLTILTIALIIIIMMVMLPPPGFAGRDQAWGEQHLGNCSGHFLWSQPLEVRENIITVIMITLTMIGNHDDDDRDNEKNDNENNDDETSDGWKWQQWK